MATARTRLRVTRAQILAFRRAVQALDARLPAGKASLRQAACGRPAGQHARAALLSLHARVEGTTATTWETPPLAQIWGPRYSAYVVDERDAPAFTLGRLPDTGPKRRLAESLTGRLAQVLGDTRMTQSAAARALDEPPNRLRYAARSRDACASGGTGQGSRRCGWRRRLGSGRRGAARSRAPLSARLRPRDRGRIRRVGRPHVAGRRSGVRRAGNVAGPGRHAAWRRMDPGDDEPLLRRPPATPARARFLPSGDTWFLFQRPGESGAARRERGTAQPPLDVARLAWRAARRRRHRRHVAPRGTAVLTIETWRRLSRPERQAVEAEAASLPLPGPASG